MSTEVEEFQNKVFEYLCKDGHPERLAFLLSLMREGASCIPSKSTYITTNTAKNSLRSYIRAFDCCKEGKERAIAALLPEDVKPKTRKIHVNLTVELEGDYPTSVYGSSWSQLKEAIKDNYIGNSKVVNVTIHKWMREKSL